MAAQDITLDLWHIANQRGNLTNEELDSFSDSTSAAHFASCLSEVVMGIGCLVASDANQKGVRSGNFQGSDTAGLLFMISACLDNIITREYIASEAAFLLKERLHNAGIPSNEVAGVERLATRKR